MMDSASLARPGSPARSRGDLGMLLSVALPAAVFGWYLQPSILFDDAAITFRYVERILGGHGFTYNDHEHVLGASNPLYTLLLAGLASSGVGVEVAARALALGTFVLGAVLAAQLTRLLSGSWLAGIAAGGLLITNSFFRSQALNGMESGLAVVLGLVTVLGIVRGRDVLAGLFLGLAVWNKLDAGMLALAVAMAWLLVRRRLPLQMAITSILVVLPWVLFAQWYFGSPIPHSFITKVQVHSAHRTDRDPTWVLRFLLSDSGLVLLLGSAASLGLLPRLGERARLAVLTLLLWLVLHALAFTVLDLGANYPWYLTVLVPPTIILSCTSARVAVAGAGTRGRSALVAAVVVLLMGLPARHFLRATVKAWMAGNPVTVAEAFDNDRRMAGIFLNEYATPGELARSGFGWVAFESRLPFNDSSGLNTLRPRWGEAYRVNHGSPFETGSHPPPIPPEFIPLATFNLASDLSPGYSWFTVFGRPSSDVARQGKRYLQYRLTALGPPQDWSGECTLADVQITDVDLRTRPPSGATFVLANDHQPVHVVFTPLLEPGNRGGRGGDTTFEIWSGTTRHYRQPVAEASRNPVILEIAGAPDVDRVPLSFVTLPLGSDADRQGHATWRCVKVVVGDAFVDLERLHSEKLRAAWALHNPVPTSDGATARARSRTDR